jgi:hypothetical protein
MMAVMLAATPMSYLIHLCNNVYDANMMRVKPAQRRHEVGNDTRDARATAGCQRNDSNDAYAVGQTKRNDGKDPSAPEWQFGVCGWFEGLSPRATPSKQAAPGTTIQDCQDAHLYHCVTSATCH